MPADLAPVRRGAKLHFLHVGKTGGTALKRALRAGGVRRTPYGRLVLHRHRFTLHDVPEDDFVLFCVRDPVARFASGFYSRRDQGRPRYVFEWTPAEERVFAAFTAPEQLAGALAGDDREQRELAEFALRHVRHLNLQRRIVGRVPELRRRLDHVVFIGRQETLDADWKRLKAVLEIDRKLKLPTDPVEAHRRTTPERPDFDEAQLAALRDWYAPDYRLLRFCEEVRAARGQTATRLDRLRSRLPSPRRGRG
jgi:hypothetical protein